MRVMMSYSGLAACALALLLCAGPAAAGEYEWKDGKWVRQAAPAEGTPAGELALIRQYVKTGQRRNAVNAAEKFQKKYADDPLNEEVMFQAGNAEFNDGRYFQAFEWYKKELDNYPAGEFSERALNREIDVAELFLAGKKRIAAGIFYLPAEDDGLDILNRVVEQAPGTEIGERAMMRVGDHQYACQRYAEAAQGYDHYMELFGKWPRAEHAALQAARATYAQYRGPEYDETPLIDAEQRFKTYQENFPAAAQKAGVGAILKAIHAARAGKVEWTAGFYKRTGRPDSAMYYYRIVVDQYPGTAAANAARQQLIAMGAPEYKKPAVKAGPAVAATSAPAPAAGAAPSTQQTAQELARFVLGSTTAPSQPATGPAKGQPTTQPAGAKAQATTQTIVKEGSK